MERANVLPITSWNLGRQQVKQEFATLNVAQALCSLELQYDVDMAFLFGGGFWPWEDDSEEVEEGEPSVGSTPDQVIVTSKPMATPKTAYADPPLPDSLRGIISDEMDLEDHMSAQASEKYSPFVELNGKRIHKAKVLWQFFKYSTSPGSTDWLKRVAGLSCFAVLNPSTTFDNDNSLLGDECLCIGDPVVMLVQCASHIFLAVIHVNQILSDSHLTFKISTDMLTEQIVEVQFQILRLEELSEDSQSPGNDTPDWTWNSQYIETPIKMRGAFIQPISPLILTKMPGQPTYLFKTSELCALAFSIFTCIPHDQHLNLPSIKQRETFPYRASGWAAFVCEFDGGMIPSAAEADVCPQCHPPFVWDRTKPLKVIEHISAHLLFDLTIDNVMNSWSLNQVTKHNSISPTQLSQLGQDKTREALRFIVT